MGSDCCKQRGIVGHGLGDTRRLQRIHAQPTKDGVSSLSENSHVFTVLQNGVRDGGITVDRFAVNLRTKNYSMYRLDEKEMIQEQGCWYLTSCSPQQPRKASEFCPLLP